MKLVKWMTFVAVLGAAQAALACGNQLDANSNSATKQMQAQSAVDTVWGAASASPSRQIVNPSRTSR